MFADNVSDFVPRDARAVRTHGAVFSGVASIWREGSQNYMKIFDAHKATRSNALNNVDVAATELYRSCCRRITGADPEGVARRDE